LELGLNSAHLNQRITLFLIPLALVTASLTACLMLLVSWASGENEDLRTLDASRRNEMRDWRQADRKGISRIQRDQSLGCLGILACCSSVLALGGLLETHPGACFFILVLVCPFAIKLLYWTYRRL
jgi:hypothetical protein